MNAKTLRLQVYPAFLSGTTRRPLGFRGELEELAQDDPISATLNALSLTALALRLEHPLSPPQFAAEPEIHDPRPILPDTLRWPLLRLLANRKPHDDLALALAWAFGLNKVRTHPFDLPRLDSFVRAHAEYLGSTAQNWAQQRDETPVAQRSYFDADDLDETTWIRGTPGRRARYISERRKLDAAAARALVQAAWSQQSAEARVRLLQALETGLSADDQPFLESLGKDRAPRVRVLAKRFLIRLPGAHGTHPALAACLERIKRSKTGILKKRPALTLELPATVKEHEVKSWIREAFAEVSCEELARALELTESAMIDAAEKDPNLLLACALMATQDRRFDLLEQLTAGPLPDAWEQLSQSEVVELTMMSAEERARWAAILIAPCADKPPAAYTAWSWLHRALEGPAPAQLLESVLRSRSWLTQVLNENILVAEWMEILAALCPSTQRARLRALLSSLDPAVTLTALPFLDIMESLEKVGHHER